jgi:acetyl-CoA C-acetyltransferase
LSVYISDVGFTKVGDHWGKSIQELAFEACENLLKASRTKPGAVIVSNAFSELSSSQSNLGPLITESLGLDGVESLSVESSGASGAAALHVAANLVSSGHVDSALVVGVEKMRDLDPAKLVLAQAMSENSEYSQFFGVSFAALNALIARLYMLEYGITREKLSAFPVIAHKNSSTVEHAQFKKKFTAEEVSRSELVADPLRVLDCAPVGDGAAAVLLVREDHMPDRTRSVELMASESFSSRSNFFERKEPLKFSSTEAAARAALKRAGLHIEDIDFFEIHDSYSIMAALIVEALGLSKPGQGCQDASAGKYDLRGDFPISTFGGMKGRGYPVGAAGVYQICEAYLQLTGKAGANQVENASKCMVHAVSGIDGSSFVSILSNRRN